MDSINNTQYKGNYLLSGNQMQILLILTDGFGILSLCMCVLTIWMVFCQKLQRNLTYQLAMYQAGSSLSLAISVTFTIFLSKLYPPLHYKSFYQVMSPLTGVLVTYFSLNIIITWILTFYFFPLTVRSENMKYQEKWCGSFAIFFPILFVWVPFIGPNSGTTGALCRIECQSGRCDLSVPEKCTSHSYWGNVIFIFSQSINLLTVLIILMVLLAKWCAKRNSPEKEPLMANITTSKPWRRALPDVLPLLAYPLIFCIFSMVFMQTYVYITFSTNVLALVLTLLLVVWSLLSSSTVLVYILTANNLKVTPPLNTPNTVEDRRLDYAPPYCSNKSSQDHNNI